MDNNNKNNIEHYLTDDNFVDWVLSPSDETEAYWQQWIIHNPDCQQTIEQASAFVRNIHAVEHQFQPSLSMDDTWSSIREKTIDKPKAPLPVKSKNTLWKYVIGILLIVGLAASLYYYLNQSITPPAKLHNIAWQLAENNEGTPQTILLSDGSKVVLEPYSSLKYPTVFAGKQRDVFLKGEAFFDIQRDTVLPFLIYANETITKVLGTSFTIKAFKNNENVEVIVKSGTVAVYVRMNSDNDQPMKQMVVNADEAIYVPLPNRKLEITANQKVVVKKNKHEAIRTIASRPILLEQKTKKKARRSKFKDAPVADFFAAMEEAYGLKINFDKERLKECTITTTLTDMEMLRKVDMVCQALALNYSEKDGQIFIKGSGCN